MARKAKNACPPARTRRMDLGMLALRLTAGGLVAGHGAQKLFGAFGGQGLAGMGGMLESTGVRPGKPWALLAGLSEFGGGMLTALGLGGPLGPIALQGSMATAIRRVHWGKPIWNTEGGAELPVVYATTGVAVALAGPGRYSLDRAFGVRVPFTPAALAAAGVAAGIVIADRRATATHQAENVAAAAETLAEEVAGEDRVVNIRQAARREADAELAGTDQTPGMIVDTHSTEDSAEHRG